MAIFLSGRLKRMLAGWKQDFPAEQKVPCHTLFGRQPCEEEKRAEKFHDNFSVPRVFPSGSLSSEKLAREKVRFCALNVSSSPLGQCEFEIRLRRTVVRPKCCPSANVVFYVAMQCSLLCLHGCLTESPDSHEVGG